MSEEDTKRPEGPPKMDVYVGGERSTSPVGIRYGRPGMVEIWGGEGGEEPTVRYMLKGEKAWIRALSNLYPNRYPPNLADEAELKLNTENVRLEDIRKKEKQKFHREEATFETAREALSQESAQLVHLALTSADDTETAKTLQIKDSLELLITDIEETRDSAIKRAYEWGIEKGLVVCR